MNESAPAGADVEPRPGAAEEPGGAAVVGPQRRRRSAGPARRRIVLWVSDDERLVLLAAARRRGRGVSLSRYVAEAALQAADVVPATPQRRRRAPSHLALAEIADAVSAVKRVGNNLNQLARDKNTTGRRPPGTFAQVERALTALDRLTDVAERSDWADP